MYLPRQHNKSWLFSFRSVNILNTVDFFNYFAWTILFLILSIALSNVFFSFNYILHVQIKFSIIVSGMNFSQIRFSIIYNRCFFPIFKIQLIKIFQICNGMYFICLQVNVCCILHSRFSPFINFLFAIEASDNIQDFRFFLKT